MELENTTPTLGPTQTSSLASSLARSSESEAISPVGEESGLHLLCLFRSPLSPE